MARSKILAPVLIGIIGTTILIGLSYWQVQRLSWKEDLIARLEVRLSSPPVTLPASLDAEKDQFRRVTVTGRFEGAPGKQGYADAPFLTTHETLGTGYRVIQPFTLSGGGRVMVDRGFVPLVLKNEGGAAVRPTPAPTGEMTVTGALLWPGERADPPYGARDNVWIARDLERMAALFDARPVLIVAETPSTVPGGKWPVSVPLTVNIRNTHLNYAITWGLLALAWSIMSVVWVRKEMGPHG